jgi:putative spermidine/putrescine transport system permease protein
MIGAGIWAGRLFALATMIILASPMVIVVVLSFSASDYIVFPPAGFSLRWYRQLLSDRELIEAFAFSVRLAALATAIAIVLGTSLSFALVRHRLRGSGALRVLALSPLVLPEVLLGLALLQFAAMRLRSNPSFWLLLIGHTVIVLPFVVQLVCAALARLNRETEDAAITLGANPLRVFWHVLLPGIGTGLSSAALLAFIFSFDNVAISLFLSSPGNETLPVHLYERTTYANDPSLTAVATVLIVVGLAAIGLLARLRGFENAADTGG